MNNFLWRSSIAAVFVCLSATAFGEERSAEFPFTDQQMKSLGVELTTLNQYVTSTTAAFAGQLVLPPEQERSITAATNSVIERVLVSEGQEVKANTPLLVLNSPDLGALQLALMEASNRSHLAQDALIRDNELFADGFIAQRRLHETQAAAQESAAGLQHARSALLLAGLDEKAVNQIAATGKVSNQITLTAPSAGIAVDVAVKPGMRVAEASLLMRIVRMDRLWVDIQVPSQLSTHWQQGTSIHLANGLEAKVLSISPLTSDTQMRLLRGVIIQGSANLHPGEFVQAELPLAADDAWDIPLAALARDDDKIYVFIRRKDAFVATEVEVLSSSGQRAQVRGELNVGDRIASVSVIALKAAWQGVGGMEEE